MSKNKKIDTIDTIDLLAVMLVDNANYRSMHGKDLYQKNTLDLTEKALQIALTNLVVDLTLGK